MPTTLEAATTLLGLTKPPSPGEHDEMVALGLVAPDGHVLPSPRPPDNGFDTSLTRRSAIRAPGVLNEAHRYPRPSSFARGIRFDPADSTMLLISGTASIDEHGATRYPGDFRAQLWRTYRNITALLSAEAAGWHDVVRTTCYLRDIERDYRDFNEIRTAFFTWLGLDPLPASTGIQARLCREDLLVEIEAIAVFPRLRLGEAR
ncbi:MAG: Rid family hydrolase [Acidobacteriota bacterium]